MIVAGMEEPTFGSGTRWPLMAEPPPLAPGDVQIWKVDIAPVATAIPGLLPRLSPDEHERARRFVFDRHRFRYVRTRAALRSILGRHLQMPASEVALRTAPGGKTFLADASASLYFNVSHSSDLALIALTRGGEIGVDLEAVRPRVDDWVMLAQRYFAAEEVEALEGYSAAERVQAFFRVWTRKEAIVKLLGDGLRMPLDRFIVPLDETAVSPVLLSDGGAVPWHLTPLTPAPAYWGACATYRRPDRVLLRQWVESGDDLQARP
jgi:4'-phosphopantetheinyl transferase